MNVGEEIAPSTVFAGWTLPRDADGIRCAACGKGYAERADNTADECRTYGCGRDMPGCECCARAFVCALCGARNVGKAEAPEAAW